jgi:hypothetical protein
MTGRVLVTVRCRRKGHVLAELAVTGDGQRVLRVCHHLVLLIDEDGQVKPGNRVPGPPLWHSHDWEARAANLVTVPHSAPPGFPASCACKRPHLVSAADIEAAVVAGEPVVITGPMR